MAEETAHPSPDSEEDGKQNLEASSGDNGIPTSAPDVTYDATILEDEHCPEGAKDCSENGDEQGSELESTAKREKVEEAVHPVERTEGDGREEEGEGGQSENEEWMDILGSGELKKKVHTMTQSCMFFLQNDVFNNNKNCGLSARCCVLVVVLRPGQVLSVVSRFVRKENWTAARWSISTILFHSHSEMVMSYKVGVVSEPPALDCAH